MRFSENLNLPILQDGDKYSKEIQNEAFNTIDRECTSIKNTIKSALDISEDVSNAIKTIGDISEELSDLKEKQNEDYYELLESNNYIGNQIRDINSQLDNMENNIYVTPEKFGAKGDGVTDDYEALNNMFNSGYNIKFGHNKTYITSKICFHYNTYGGVIDGNNSTIKLIDNSGILEQIKNSSQTVAISQLLFLGNDNITIKNLNFDCNIDNNYFIFNGEKYYGYHADIKVDGIPSKYITIDCIYTQGNNDIKIYNCKFKDFGNGISLGGGVHDTNQLSYNFYVENCTFEHGFRDQIYCFQVRNVNIKNCTFTNNQRKAIQFYQNVGDCYVDNCNINVDVNAIRKWYPTWSKNNSDAELSGIASQNPNYYLDRYRTFNINITNTRFNVEKTSIWFRGYSNGLTVKGCEFNGSQHQINLNSGVSGKVLISDNKFNNSNYAIWLRIAKDSRLDFTTNDINSVIDIKNNAVMNKGYLLIIEDEQNKTDYYKSLSLNVVNNIMFEDGKFISLNTNRTTEIEPFIRLTQENNMSNGSYIKYNYSDSPIFISPLNVISKDKLYYKVDKSGSGYVELLKIKTNGLQKNFFFNCKIYAFSGGTCDYGEVVGIIRSHYNSISSNGYADLYINNKRRSMPVNAIKVVDTLEDGYRVFRFYLNVPSNANGKYACELEYNNVGGYVIEQNKKIEFVTPIDGNINESKE